LSEPSLGSDCFGQKKNSGEKKVRFDSKKIRYKVDVIVVCQQKKIINPHCTGLYLSVRIWQEGIEFSPGIS
jgi:hypothetical protein